MAPMAAPTYLTPGAYLELERKATHKKRICERRDHRDGKVPVSHIISSRSTQQFTLTTN